MVFPVPLLSLANPSFTGTETWSWPWLRLDLAFEIYRAHSWCVDHANASYVCVILVVNLEGLLWLRHRFSLAVSGGLCVYHTLKAYLQKLRLAFGFLFLHGCDIGVVLRLNGEHPF